MLDYQQQAAAPAIERQPTSAVRCAGCGCLTSLRWSGWGSIPSDGAAQVAAQEVVFYCASCADRDSVRIASAPHGFLTLAPAVQPLPAGIEEHALETVATDSGSWLYSMDDVSSTERTWLLACIAFWALMIAIAASAIV